MPVREVLAVLCLIAGLALTTTGAGALWGYGGAMLAGGLNFLLLSVLLGLAAAPAAPETAP